MSFNAHASYHVASYETDKISFSLPVRLIVVGKGNDLGLLFQEVARARAIKYAENRSKELIEQIVIVATDEKEEDSEWSLKRFGFKVMRSEKKTLDGEKLIEEMLKFKKILSLDIFSHSSVQFGVHLDGRSNRLNSKTDNVNALKDNFMPGAYAYLHGCNTGFNLAPFLSHAWKIPVAGSMTSTNFQKLHNDGNFYLTEEGYAPNSEWAKVNALSNDRPWDCSKGACLRLKPDNTPYVGFWGSYQEGGLPFYKFFCTDNSEEVCLSAMAKSMLSHSLNVNVKVQSSLEDYKKGVIDFLCPVSSKKDLRGECQAKLEEAILTKDMTYNPFSRAQVECDFKKCKAEVSCKKVIFTDVPKPGTCHLENKMEGPATTLVREYIAYLAAYKYLAK